MAIAFATGRCEESMGYILPEAMIPPRVLTFQIVLKGGGFILTYKLVCVSVCVSVYTCAHVRVHVSVYQFKILGIVGSLFRSNLEELDLPGKKGY